MSTELRERPVRAGAGNGGVPARRAVIRWSWRMFRREWRQQLLVLALIVVALAATVIGAAVATNTPPPSGAGFGTAQDMVTLPGSGSQLAGQLATLRQRFGRVDVIENQTIAIPGSIGTYDLRAQDPHGPFGTPMLALISGRYPAGPGQVAVTPGLAATLNLKVAGQWTQGGRTRLVTGIVRNPQSLLDEFALVTPGQVTAPTTVTALFTAPPSTSPNSLGPLRPYLQTRHGAAANNPLNPKTIVLALATVGMLLIALVAVGGFTVLAQRRLRSLGMLGALGATDRNIRLVVRANGVLVGVVGALAGTILGLAGWLAYRPHLEASAHHLIGVFQLPWVVIGPAIAIAVVATYFAAARPARAVTRIPVVAALSGRPAPPKQVHRSALPGVILFAAAAVLLSFSGKSNGNGGGAPELIGGIVLLVIAIILLAPFCLVVLASGGRRAPIAARLALRDLARYRARSGSALSAISLGVFIASLVCVLTAQRYGNVLDYAGPNVAPNQVIVYQAGSGRGEGPGRHDGTPAATISIQAQAAVARNIARALGAGDADVIGLDSAGASLQHAAAGRSWSGPVYVATPRLLAAFGIKASQVNPDADVLTMRPGLSGLSEMQLIYGGNDRGGGHGPQDVGPDSFPCPKGSCLANPVIQQVGALPSGTSAPNTVITEHAIHTLGLPVNAAGWLIQAPHNPTAAQITDARLTAAAAGMTIETKSSTPSSAEILDYATVFGIVLALGILAMTIGLIRSETARDLRTLTATGASSMTRRELTAATAFALALGGAVLGTLAAYVAAIGYSWANPLDGLSGLSSVPAANLLIILIGMPTVAAVVGWLMAGREPPVISRQPLE